MPGPPILPSTVVVRLSSRAGWTPAKRRLSMLPPVMLEPIFERAET
jgi:hypothetical protein